LGSFWRLYGAAVDRVAYSEKWNIALVDELENVAGILPKV
jgi:hypothetical protein